jgi:DNA repair protein SbcD/Mre11
LEFPKGIRANSDLSTLPPEIDEMLGVLPPEIRQQVEAELIGDDRNAVLSDVRALILDALGTKGGQTS